MCSCPPKSLSNILATLYRILLHPAYYSYQYILCQCHMTSVNTCTHCASHSCSNSIFSALSSLLIFYIRGGGWRFSTILQRETGCGSPQALQTWQKRQFRPNLQSPANLFKLEADFLPSSASADPPAPTAPIAVVDHDLSLLGLAGHVCGVV